jgi:hypothetical protein
VVTQLQNFLGKPNEDIRVVYIQGSTGGGAAGLAGSVFVRVQAGQARVIGLGHANPPTVPPTGNTPPKA